MDDTELLRAYAETHAQGAFSALVARHLGLVYSSALRQTRGDAMAAEDITQEVFIILAEKATSLCEHPNILGWLHTTARFKVKERLRSDRRRRLREQIASPEKTFENDGSAKATSEELWPVLDEALAELGAPDREILLRRFFEGKPFAQIAAHFQLNESSAQKRVERALEKLRVRLRKRGILSSSAALAVHLSQPSSLLPATSRCGRMLRAAIARPPRPNVFTQLRQIFATFEGSLGATALVVSFAAIMIALGRLHLPFNEPSTSTSSVSENRGANLSAVQASLALPGPSVTLGKSVRASRSAAAPSDSIYRLVSGDNVEVKVSGAGNLVTKQSIDALGFIRLPYVGDVSIAGKTVPEAERLIVNVLVEKRILRAPQVTLEIVNNMSAAIKVLGMVEKPGNLQLRPGTASIELLDLVLETGGFIKRAKIDEVRVTHTDDRGVEHPSLVNVEKMLMTEKGALKSFLIFPGDRVYIPERLW